MARKASPGVRFSGLKELDRALGKADKDLRSDLRARLKDVAEIVAAEARTIAGRKTRRNTGDLVKGIKPYALGGRAGVRSGAVHRGFNYPMRLEYEARGGSSYGPRASLNPALDAKQNEVSEAAERLVDELADSIEGRM